MRLPGGRRGLVPGGGQIMVTMLVENYAVISGEFLCWICFWFAATDGGWSWKVMIWGPCLGRFSVFNWEDESSSWMEKLTETLLDDSFRCRVIRPWNGLGWAVDFNRLVKKLLEERRAHGLLTKLEWNKNLKKTNRLCCGRRPFPKAWQRRNLLGRPRRLFLWLDKAGKQPAWYSLCKVRACPSD